MAGEVGKEVGKALGEASLEEVQKYFSVRET
jgi:hypothetical protein